MMILILTGLVSSIFCQHEGNCSKENEEVARDNKISNQPINKRGTSKDTTRLKHDEKDQIGDSLVN